MCAGEYSQEKCAECLIKVGADVNAIDNIGYTALMYSAEDDEEKCVSLFLKAGACINKTRNKDGNAIQLHCNEHKPVTKEIFLLLFAAGEILDPSCLDEMDDTVHEVKMSTNLKDLCRHAIRKHLIKLNSHLHLFNRIPQLGLPSSVTRYLLLYMSLE